MTTTPAPTDDRAGPVLVVDDDVEIRSCLRLVLETEGYAVLEAADGTQALDTLTHAPLPCVILLDLMMPVMSGWEFLDALRESQKLAGIPVVVVSAYPPPQGVPSLKKPLDLDGLLGVVSEHCSKSHGPTA
ncbi:MAG: response regulator [Myxococcota bacterium]